MSEQELYEWMVDNYVAWRMGTLEEEKLKKLEDMDPDWFKHIESDIAAANFGKIVKANYAEAIESNTDIPLQLIVITVASQIKSDLQQFGKTAVEN